MFKKKVLIFIDWYLPGYKAGGPIQSVANMVEHLKDEFEFFLITRDTDYCETIPYTTIKSNQWNTLSNGVKVYYLSKKQLNCWCFYRLIKEVKPDFAYLNGIFSLYFTLIPLLFLKKKGIFIVLAARGMLAESALAVKGFKKLLFIRLINISGFFNNILFHATNEIEEKDIRRVFGSKKVKVAANLSQKLPLAELYPRVKDGDAVKLVNIARISPEKNLLFALQILQKVSSNVEYDIFGPIYNQAYWGNCCDIIKQLPNNIKVNYKGSIESHKVLNQLKKYHFMFMPTLGENFGHIILQSFMVGCPVIISDQTPWKELQLKNIGWDISLNQAELFTKVISDCTFMNQINYNTLSTSAYNFAKQYINNKEILIQNKNLFFL